MIVLYIVANREFLAMLTNTQNESNTNYIILMHNQSTYKPIFPYTLFFLDRYYNSFSDFL